MRQTPYDLERGDGSHSGRFGSDDSASGTIQDVNLWVYSPEETNIDTQYGDRIGGSLQALALPDANVEVGDELEHGSDTYEVDEYQHLPNDDNQQLMLLGLTRVVN